MFSHNSFHLELNRNYTLSLPDFALSVEEKSEHVLMSGGGSGPMVIGVLTPEHDA